MTTTLQGTRRPTKIYPSTENYQYRDASPIKLMQAINYLQRLRDSVPDGDQRESVELRGWQTLEVWYTKTLSPAEVQAERMAEAREIVRGLSGRELSETELERLRALLGA